MRLFLFFCLFICFMWSDALQLRGLGLWRSTAAIAAPLVLTSCLVLGPVDSACAKEVSKADFLAATSQGKNIDVRDKRGQSAQVRVLEDGAATLVGGAAAGGAADPVRASAVGTVRVVDLGGNRGARGLATNGVTGGSLVDQLKAYGGPGAPVKEDKSLKNPLKFKEGIQDQLQLYKSLQAK